MSVSRLAAYRCGVQVQNGSDPLAALTTDSFSIATTSPSQNTWRECDCDLLHAGRTGPHYAA